MKWAIFGIDIMRLGCLEKRKYSDKFLILDTTLINFSSSHWPRPGDGRRASVCKKSGVPGNRPRRASAAHRRDSIRPVRSPAGTRSPSMLLTPTSAEIEMIKDPRLIEQARRHRRVAMIVLATFFFILAAAVLAVVVTLTHSSFHSPPVGSRELAEHRANVNELSSLHEVLVRFAVN